MPLHANPCGNQNCPPLPDPTPTPTFLPPPGTSRKPIGPRASVVGVGVVCLPWLRGFACFALLGLRGFAFRTHLMYRFPRTLDVPQATTESIFQAIGGKVGGTKRPEVTRSIFQAIGGEVGEPKRPEVTRSIFQAIGGKWVNQNGLKSRDPSSKQ